MTNPTPTWRRRKGLKSLGLTEAPLLTRTHGDAAANMHAPYFPSWGGPSFPRDAESDRACQSCGYVVHAKTCAVVLQQAEDVAAARRIGKQETRDAIVRKLLADAEFDTARALLTYEPAAKPNPSPATLTYAGLAEAVARMQPMAKEVNADQQHEFKAFKMRAVDGFFRRHMEALDHVEVIDAVTAALPSRSLAQKRADEEHERNVQALRRMNPTLRVDGWPPLESERKQPNTSDVARAIVDEGGEFMIEALIGCDFDIDDTQIAVPATGTRCTLVSRVAPGAIEVKLDDGRMAFLGEREVTPVGVDRAGWIAALDRLGQ